MPPSELLYLHVHMKIKISRDYIVSGEIYIFIFCINGKSCIR
nr:MAG TPA: hypothetical protein [Caudoviricetes sp.]